MYEKIPTGDFKHLLTNVKGWMQGIFSSFDVKLKPYNFHLVVLPVDGEEEPVSVLHHPENATVDYAFLVEDKTAEYLENIRNIRKKKCYKTRLQTYKLTDFQKNKYQTEQIIREGEVLSGYLKDILNLRCEPFMLFHHGKFNRSAFKLQAKASKSKNSCWLFILCEFSNEILSPHYQHNSTPLGSFPCFMQRFMKNFIWSNVHQDLFGVTYCYRWQHFLREAATAYIWNLASPLHALQLGEYPKVGGHFGLFEQLSLESYEQQESSGVIIFNKKADYAIQCLDVAPSENIYDESYQVRSLRKLLKISEQRRNGECYPLVLDNLDGDGVVGFRRVENIEQEEIYRIEFHGKHHWSLSFGKANVFSVHNGRIFKKSARLTRQEFEDRIQKTTWKITPNVNALWDIITHLLDNNEGCVLLISDDAHSEASRLYPTSIIAEPFRLTGSFAASCARIDGAILITPNATCHGFGVILDGEAKDGRQEVGLEKGERGARYNSIARYIQTPFTRGAKTCMAVVISDDGMVNIVPE